jgi:hypothetical protein
MAKLHKTIRKATPKALRSGPADKVDEEVGNTWDSLNPEMPQAPADKTIPLPDEEELERQRRRKSRGGGRASTVLTSNDEGLGG